GASAIRDDDVRRISCDGLSGEPSRSGRPAAGRAGYVYGLDESVVAGGARSARKTLHGCVLPDGLRRADQSAWLARARGLLLSTGAAKAISDLGDQRADCPAGASQREREAR